MTLLLVLSGVYLWKAHRRPGNAVLFWILAVIDVVSLLVMTLSGQAGRQCGQYCGSSGLCDVWIRTEAVSGTFEY